jgi:hypothetical protein
MPGGSMPSRANTGPTCVDRRGTPRAEMLASICRIAQGFTIRRGLRGTLP